MEWESDNCLQLISLYEDKPELWQPDHKYHFNKLKKNDAWEYIANEMNITVDVAKAKLNSLLSSYRREKSKETGSKGTGKGK